MGKWSVEKLQTDLRKLPKEKLNATYLRNKRMDLYSASLKLFGSVSKAVNSIGIDYCTEVAKTKQNYWTKEKCQEELRKIPKEKLNTETIRQEHSDLEVACRRCFGSYRQAIETIGMNFYEDVAKMRMNYWTKEKCQQELKKIPKHQMNVASMCCKHYDLYSACKRLFGSYPKAIESIGLNYDEIKVEGNLTGTLWQPWEMWCNKAIKLLYPSNKILYNKSMKNHKNKHLRPDFQIPSLKLIIEVKTNPWNYRIPIDSKNYYPYCNLLEFWFMEGKRESYTPKITFKNSDDILLELRLAGVNKEKIDELRNEVKSLKNGFDPYTTKQKRISSYSCQC